MASAVFVPAGPITIPNGGSVDVEVVWSLNPGTPDQPGYLRLELDGQVLIDAPITKQGTPAEQAPTNAVLSSDVAAITSLGSNRYRLS